MKLTYLTKAVAALALILAPMAGPAGAAGPTGSVPAGVSTADASFQRLLGGQEQLRGSRLLTARDLEASLDQSYASGMNDLFNQVAGNAKLASESKGTKGDVQGLKAFEDLAQVHEATLNKEADANDDFMGRIQSGDVLIDARLVAGWPVRDQQAFKAFLSPKAVGSYPSLSKLTAIPQEPQRLALAGPTATQCSAAIPCIAPCYAQQWTACVNCIMQATAKAKTAWAQYQSCKGGAGKPKWMPLKVWQAGCLTKFIAVLA
ncbi:hypothetical protein QO010_001326 [Caulobacter ginsengisoli]|uniref:DUF3347 domain-containing protein n=1 Tax=Caulobacter ginsengisoli TaxID=400775 RepID=A0ABU0INH3_9CAUL|nr:hypothetical protein [Caulobacter ginsengisoli]MDQ0463555.1 hypothetical protein [Caulobacter ginsengisoli]